MSAAGEITVVAPELADMRRDVEVPTAIPLLAPRHQEMQCGPCDSIAVYAHGCLGDLQEHLDDLDEALQDFLRDDCIDEQTCARCITACAFFFFCDALGDLFLEICCVSRCLPCFCSGFMEGFKEGCQEDCCEEVLKPRNRTEKLFAFLAKNLSKLWVSTLVILFIQWVLFRPIDVKPRLGTAAIHAFDLQQADAAMAATPHLRFNLTGYLLFRSAHNYYTTYYDNLAVSVLYTGEKLGPVDGELPSFKQDPQGRTVTRFVLVGQLRNASRTVAEMFSADRDKGLLEMVVRIRVTLAYKSWPFKEEYFAIYDCPLSSPFPQNGEPAFSSPAWCKTNDV